MAFKLKLPSFGKKKLSPTSTVAPATVVDKTILPAGDKKAPATHGGVVFLSGFPIAKQLQILGALVLVMVLLIVGLVFRDNRETAYTQAYMDNAHQMRLLSQVLARVGVQAGQGRRAAFRELKLAREEFTRLLSVLAVGGEQNGVSLPPVPDEVRGQIDVISVQWKKTDEDAGALLDQEASLVSLANAVSEVNRKQEPSTRLLDQFIAQRTAGGSTREVTLANQMQVLALRIAKNANALLISERFAPELALAIDRDAKSLREILDGFAGGSIALRITAVGDSAGRKLLTEIDELLADDFKAIASVLGNMPKLVRAKEASARLASESEALLAAATKLEDTLRAGTARTGLFLALFLLGLLIVAIVALMAKVFFDDVHQRATESDRQRKESESTNRSNQDAILRLMNELGDLADGDLTVTATVSEDITGAIADSINYTIDELRVLVGRINDAATRVSATTESAQKTSARLLAAAELQSREIQNAGHSALDMARSMNQVSGNASQSARVARQSLAAAEKGTQAVEDSIKGMNDIRDQIQETSKRIKRLGESSQEIGEIVELISDITEQTNVLALNAAIQAASAGDAGRGFTVVAEEVQRLAERSGEATKQIAAIVKTIQTDTQDAVSAMEQSTQGVVEGAKRSDAAGQALAEIGRVSRDLAALIETISTATQSQAKSATSVAEAMQRILHITEQTTAGTQKTAAAVGELASLATELKGSVAGFKVS
jgi:twitching motility protein PilJ